jgi:glycosyltransferase involved in cell wall biosynthesis
MEQQPFLTIFIPAYNEEENLRLVVKKCLDFLKTLRKSFEIIIINDGSTDKTGFVADELAKADHSIKAVHHPFNIGYGGAQKSGFRYATGKYVALIPGDNQFEPSCLRDYLKHTDSFDIIVGWRKSRKDAFTRKIFSKSFNLLMRWLFDINLRDINCVKMINRKVIDAIQIESRGAFVDAEIMIKAQHLGFSYTEIQVAHFPRMHGKEKGAHPLVVMITFFELFRLWRKRFLASRKPGVVE